MMVGICGEFGDGSGGVDVGSGGDGGVSGRKDGSHGRWQ